MSTPTADTPATSDRLPPETIAALLDTAAHWCVLQPVVAVELDVDLDPGTLDTRPSTRFGLFTGRLERIPVTFLANEGEELTVGATWFVSPDWPGPTVIGWKGCLERMGFALAPDDDSFYFRDL